MKRCCRRASMRRALRESTRVISFTSSASGKNNQIEVDVPVNFQDQNHTWYGGVGDTTLAVKLNVLSELGSSGLIFSYRVASFLPTGEQDTRFLERERRPLKPSPHSTSFFRRIHLSRRNSARDLPRHTDIAPQSIFFNTAAIGQSIAADHRVWAGLESHDGIRRGARPGG